MKCLSLGYDQKKCKGLKQFQSKGRSKSRPRGEKLDIGTRQEILADNTVMSSTIAVYKSLAEEKETVAVPVHPGDPSNTTATMSNNAIVPTIARVLEVQKVKKSKGKEKMNPPQPQNDTPKPSQDDQVSSTSHLDKECFSCSNEHVDFGKLLDSTPLTSYNR